jgi:hypothetical protein
LIYQQNSGLEALIYNKNILRDVLIEDLLKARREEILKISARHGAFNVRVSARRLEERPERGAI